MKKFIALTLVLVMLLALAACGSSDGAGTTDDAAASATAQPEAVESQVVETTDEKRILRVGCMESGGGYDPFNSEQNEIGNDLVYEPIAQRMPDGTLEPWCCESYEWTDETTLVFHMRDDVYFADGDQMTGEDVLFTFEAWTQGIHASDYAALDIENSYVSDDGMTVTFVFFEPFGVFESGLDIPHITNKSAVEGISSDDEIWWNTSYGSGPYEVVENITGSHSTYRLRDDYWNKDFEPQWDEIIINYYSEATAMFIAFENGELDLVCSVGANDAARLQTGDTQLGDKAEYEFISDNSVYCLNLNNNRAELQDPKVREAIAYAIDKDGLGEVAFGVLYKTADSQLSEKTKYYISTGGYAYDLEYAKQCMAESNYPDGFTLDVVAQNGTETTAMWEVIQGCLAEIGITLNFQSYDLTSCLELWMQETGNDMFFMNVYGGNSELDPWKSIGQSKAESPFPASRVPDEEYQEHLYAGTYTSDNSVRQENYEWLQEWLHENFQCIPLVENLVCYTYNTDVVDHCECYTASTPRLMWCFAAE